MDHSQQRNWGKAIAIGESNVSINIPPIPLHRFWTQVQGAMNEFKKPLR